MYNRIPKANMLTRYLYGDGVTGQQERMIRDKRKTLSRALLYSYQAALVKKLYDDKDTIERRALNRIMMKKLFQLGLKVILKLEIFFSGWVQILIG